MKPFNWYLYRNFPGPPELGMVLFGISPRIVGICFHKKSLVGEIGIKKIITIYLWKWEIKKSWI